MNLSASRKLFRCAFSLIEIMMVVAILGLVGAMAMPSITSALKKEGMRKAVSDIMDVCASARARAIIGNQTVSVTFRPGDRSFSTEGGGGGGESSVFVSSSALPDGVEFAMLDINMIDCGAAEWAKVRFFPNGTCDELTVVLHYKDQWKKITLDFATASTVVSDVDK